MLKLPSESGNEVQQQPTCEFVNKCSYAKGCACKDVQETPLAARTVDTSPLEICREVQPNCSARMYFGYTSVICMCRKRQRQPAL